MQIDIKDVNLHRFCISTEYGESFFRHSWYEDVLRDDSHVVSILTFQRIENMGRGFMESEIRRIQRQSTSKH